MKVLTIIKVHNVNPFISDIILMKIPKRKGIPQKVRKAFLLSSHNGQGETLPYLSSSSFITSTNFVGRGYIFTSVYFFVYLFPT